MLQLSWKPYTLQLKRVFRISRGARSNAPLMLIRLSFNGYVGIGEASMPPLYGESFETANAFLSKLQFSEFSTPFETERILQYVNDLAPGNQAVKAAIDIALHDLIGNLLQLPVHQYFGLSAVPLATSMTIGLDKPEEMAERAKEFSNFRYLKIKLGTGQDRQIIEAIRRVSDQPLFVDANQAWQDRQQALDMIFWLKEKGVVFIEQPMPRDRFDDQGWLKTQSPLPIIGDESVQRLSDIQKASQIFHGINIKLMKCTGLREGFKMAVAAKSLGMKVMLGCMSETSCAISAAAQLGALADWVDLDGNLEAVNDPFRGVQLLQGNLILNTLPGLGLTAGDWNAVEGDASGTNQKGVACQ